MVQVVSQELSTSTSAMAVVNAKIGAFGPSLVLPLLWLDNVQDDGYPVFVVIPDQSLVGVGCVRSHYSIAFETALGLLVVRNHNPLARLDFKLCVNSVCKHRILHH